MPSGTFDRPEALAGKLPERGSSSTMQRSLDLVEVGRMRLIAQHGHVAEHRAGFGDACDVPAILDDVDRTLEEKEQLTGPTALRQYELAFLEDSDGKAGQ